MPCAACVIASKPTCPLMGPSVAQDIVENFLPYKNGAEGYITEDIHFIENRRRSITRA